METASSILFSVGVIVTAIALAAHVGHAVLLANGRRAAGLRDGAASRPSRPAR